MLDDSRALSVFTCFLFFFPGPLNFFLSVSELQLENHLVHVLTGYSGIYHANTFLLCSSSMRTGDGTVVPEQYKSQPHISADIGAPSKSATDNTLTSIHNDIVTDELLDADQVKLPIKQVSWNKN